MKCFVGGDTHGYYNHINRLIKEKSPETLIICGDFGYWPHSVPLEQLDTKNTKIYFCDGNHEQHDLLSELSQTEITEVYNNVFYVPRGVCVELYNKKFLFVGGAESVDKDYLTEGHDWFPQESLTEEQFNNLPDIKPDIIISHAAPFFVESDMGLWMKTNKHKQTPLILDKVHEKYVPKYWFFGHYHFDYRRELKNTIFFGLTLSNHMGWWRCIDDILFKEE